MKKIIVSACLLGCACRYDGKSVPCQKVIDLASEGTVLIPVCPEQMGGLSTPRNPSERQRGKDGKTLDPSLPGAIIMNNGTDVTDNYNRGAKIALDIAKLSGAEMAILKSGSPSCGKGIIYDGSFTGKKTEGNGITVDAFEAAGIKVINETDL